jgi:ketosteroid isomerase-like protein
VADSTDEAAVRAVNRRFYDAFEARDLDAMSELWEHNDAVVCTHPGWRTLRGWASVAASWFALFGNPDQMQFILTEETVQVSGDIGWVTVDENLIAGDAGTTVAALNLFRRVDGVWRVVAHHGSPVAPQAG